MIKQKSDTGNGGKTWNYYALITAIVAGAVIFLLFPAIMQEPTVSDASVTSIISSPQTLSIAGSTTIQPVSEILASAYMSHHPGVTITVAGGGSGEGISRTGDGEIDLGAASRKVKPGEMERYPDLHVYQIGGSAVVMIVACDYPSEEITCEEVAALYNSYSDDLSNLPNAAHIQNVIQRSEQSGTEETFAQWALGEDVKSVDDAMTVTDTGADGIITPIGVETNQDVINAVKNYPNAIGFVDYGYAAADTMVKILRICDRDDSIALPATGIGFRDAIWQELSLQNGENDVYIEALTRPLNYLTKGEPSALEEDFITFTQSSEAQKYFNEVGYFSMNEFSGSQQ